MQVVLKVAIFRGLIRHSVHAGREIGTIVSSSGYANLSANYELLKG